MAMKDKAAFESHSRQWTDFVNNLIAGNPEGRDLKKSLPDYKDNQAAVDYYKGRVVMPLKTKHLNKK
jgi:hypothetical protein